MRDGEKEYAICKEACINKGCYCPEDYKFHTAIANTPAFIRAYFFDKGFEECKKECDCDEDKLHPFEISFGPYDLGETFND